MLLVEVLSNDMGSVKEDAKYSAGSTSRPPPHTLPRKATQAKTVPRPYTPEGREQRNGHPAEGAVTPGVSRVFRVPGEVEAMARTTPDTLLCQEDLMELTAFSLRRVDPEALVPQGSWSHLVQMTPNQAPRPSPAHLPSGYWTSQGRAYPRQDRRMLSRRPWPKILCAPRVTPWRASGAL